ncbi:TPA: hypothetical protein MH390_23710 [Klebsiella pneumoniae]|nr:hypothetical protein [Klebsiella pneumoniae]QIA78828.1 hypothetical protein FEE38_03540 [Klebsiella pneumoniae]HBW8710647.1 hypothetical protein [Klebsiella pneumoniae]HBX3201535.1 hypothetical protein [Klebsiella pneumoniae]HBX5139377.1 hypothetical protein [Klebsiella pneumoniae]
MLLSYLVVELPFRLLQLCLKGSNGKSGRSPGKSVARTIRYASFRCRISIAYFLPAHPSGLFLFLITSINIKTMTMHSSAGIPFPANLEEITAMRKGEE